MRRYVDAGLLPGASWAVLRDGELVDERAVGFADLEAGTPLARDHLFRAYSNTKLVTSCAVLMLHEAGAFDLDEPIGRRMPQLADRRVLRPGAENERALFGTLSATGGIVNAYAAVKLAEETARTRP